MLPFKNLLLMYINIVHCILKVSNTLLIAWYMNVSSFFNNTKILNYHLKCLMYLEYPSVLIFYVLLFISVFLKDINVLIIIITIRNFYLNFNYFILYFL